MKRSEAREQAFILIFERSFKEESIDEIIEEAQIGRNLQVDDYAYDLAKQVCDNLPWLDQVISNQSKKWKLNRMSRVALSILRMSLWEIDHVDTVPVGASINEAVELAKNTATRMTSRLSTAFWGRMSGGSAPARRTPQPRRIPRPRRRRALRPRQRPPHPRRTPLRPSSRTPLRLPRKPWPT